MSFEIGDLAVCVDDSPCIAVPYPGKPFSVKRGTVLRVDGLSPNRPYGCCLHFAGRLGWFNPARFRKLNDEPDDIDLIERIKACRPMKQPVTVSVDALLAERERVK